MTDHVELTADRGEGQKIGDQRANSSLNLDVEVTKVIEVGVALGLTLTTRRGLGKRKKMRIVFRTKPNFLFIQESKLKVFDSSVIRSLSGSWLTRGVGVDAIGASGGIISLWNDDAFKVDACVFNKIVSFLLEC
ncbi:hypothetical protein LWI28_026469 [Acer negundo]|uniref:Uncharacterized protein n=1 Tax=Acer negundo TaxID=4023 RepID=A0AAD5NI69_ACENE|nr:hypothetical protein LWI28_026469 [Acer negundo]